MIASRQRRYESRVRDGIVYINDEPVKRERVDDFVDRDWRGNVVRIPRYRETLPNGVTYATLDMVQNGDTDNTPVFTGTVVFNAAARTLTSNSGNFPAEFAAGSQIQVTGTTLDAAKVVKHFWHVILRSL